MRSCAILGFVSPSLPLPTSSTKVLARDAESFSLLETKLSLLPRAYKCRVTGLDEVLDDPSERRSGFGDVDMSGGKRRVG